MSVQLYVSCYKGHGSARRCTDAGVHATYPDRAMAESVAPSEIRWLQQFYSDVQWKLVETPQEGPCPSAS